MRKKIALFLCLIFLIAVCGEPVHADTGYGSIHITQMDIETKEAVPGVRLSLYRIGTYEDNRFSLSAPFDAVDVSQLTQNDISHETIEELDALIEENAPEAVAESVTDEDGQAAFSGLEDGVYFVKQTNTDADFDELGYTYRTDSYVISLPRFDEKGNSTRYVSCSPKGYLVRPDNTQVIVYKEWKDSSDKQGIRPEKIDVGLYNGDTLVETVELDAANNWRYAWSGLDESGVWSVKEESVPDGYASEITSEENSFTIVNTLTGSSSGNSGNGSNSGGRPETGDNAYPLIFAVLLFAAAGVAFRFAGNRKEE